MSEKEELNNFDVINEIFDNCELTSTQKLVALGILKHRNKENFACHPKLETIMKNTSLSRPAVRKAIQALEKRKIITRIKLVTGKRVDVTKYFFIADMNRQKEILKNRTSPLNRNPENSDERDLFAEFF